MLELRPLEERDISLVETWLNKEHVKRWYEVPHLGITIQDWMHEIKERGDEFKWLTYLIVSRENRPIGLCQYYKCTDSDEDFGAIPPAGSYGIDYLIGEEACLGKGYGKKMVAMLADKIFTFPDAQIITADIDKTNIASEKVLLSCGFTRLDGSYSRYILQKPIGLNK